MNVQATATQLYFHRNSVLYHLNTVYKRTGKNPRNFYDLCELVPLARDVIKQAEHDLALFSNRRGDLCNGEQER
jgi:hypothetical protein